MSFSGFSDLRILFWCALSFVVLGALYLLACSPIPSVVAKNLAVKSHVRFGIYYTKGQKDQCHPKFLV